MPPIGIVALTLALAAGAEPASAPAGYLYQPAFELDKELRGPAEPYEPRAGDVILETDDRLSWAAGHLLVKSAHPHHSLLVIERPEGGFAVVQAGGGLDEPAKVVTEDLMRHLTGRDAKTGRQQKRIWVRRRREPLTPEQSAALTSFAQASEGKRYSSGRLLLLMTPLRPKGPLRTAWLGKADFDQRSFFCSELTAAALAAAGLLDPGKVRPAATFPRDLFLGTSHNYWVARGLKPMNDDWEPPARWTSRSAEFAEIPAPPK